MNFNVRKHLFGLLAVCVSLPLLAQSNSTGRPAQDFPYVVPVETGDSDFVPGDSITIQEMRGTTDDVQAGGTYCVTGTYTLNSQEEADLSFFATTTNTKGGPIDPRQTVRVKKGTGSFRLIKPMADEGYLHLTFYSRTTGEGFGGVYFGQGQWVLRDKHFSYRAAGAEGGDVVSSAGANRALFDYLGNPVAPPALLNASYTKEGLTRAMQAAAQGAGVTLVKLEIDDSEFPFLVGMVFANTADKEKVKEQIRQLAAYSDGGGVGTGTSYAMNVIPSSAFPKGTEERIYHRLMVRTAVLSDKINGKQ